MFLDICHEFIYNQSIAGQSYFMMLYSSWTKIVCLIVISSVIVYNFSSGLGLIMSEYCSDQSSGTFAPVRYDSFSLFRIRSGLKHPIILGLHRKSTIVNRLKQLGILRYRGKRSGINLRRNIEVVMRKRETTFEPLRHAGYDYVRKDNLIYPTMMPCVTDTLFRFSCQNVRSAVNKSALICDVIERNKTDIVVLTETWLRDDDIAALGSITPNGYYIYHKARFGRECKENNTAKSNITYGGVALVIAETVRSKTFLLNIEVKTFEYLCCKISSPHGNFAVIGVYRPGSKPATKLFFTEFTSLLEIIATFNFPFFIIGDFNIRLDRPEDPNTINLKDLFDLFSLCQHVSEPTHELGGILDLIITSQVSDCVVNDVCVQPSGISDHFLITCGYHHVREPFKVSKIPVRRWHNMDLNSFKRDLVSTDLCGPFNSLNDRTLTDICLLYDRTLTDLLNIHVPLEMMKLSSRSQRSPWFNLECKAAKSKAVKLKRIYYVTKNLVDRTNWINELKENRVLYQKAKDLYWSDKLQANSKDPKKLWSNLNYLLGRGRDTGACRSGLNASEFLTFFEKKVSDVALSTQNAPAPVILSTATCSFVSFNEVSEVQVIKLMMSAPNKQCALDPLPMWLLKQCSEMLGPIITYICNRSFAEGCLPVPQKTALVNPLLKKANLDPSDLKSYRPISNLPFLSKLMERCVNLQLVEYLNYNLLFPERQSAYRSYHSTETALLKTYSDWVEAIDEGDVVLLTLLDMSAAFDTVDHVILLERLAKQYGIGGLANQWLGSYLADRQQMVVYNASKSDMAVVARGVPQGSVLGPLLFELYSGDVQKIIASHDLQGHAYADDNQIYFRSSKSELIACKLRLTACIDDITDWMASNRLRLNPDKTEVVWFHSSRKTASIPTDDVLIGNVSIKPATDVRSLGVIFDNNLSMKNHVSSVVSSCFNQIRMLRTIRRSLNQDQLKGLLHAFVSTRLDYCNSLYAGQPECLIHRLQMVQNAAARLYAGFSSRRSVTKLLSDDLHWLKVPFRIIYKLCVLVFRCLRGTAPSYLTGYCVRLMDVPSRLARNRSAISGDLLIPRTRLQTYGNRSFAIAGPSAWNSLPVDLKNEESLEIFKNRLKTHLFKCCYS